ncbi:dnaJ homolog subfamily B member 14 isoform X1 [Drosophila persimilis]|uniref:dnaJ homolog subfamily B member 14 isoform X1 n=2 Tax=Drosophila persimilis TaxID=7234 RepID=UPI000F082FC7|nr:dnaJ homolog subfamily B member 14 isoform X1 [Drosophila persimilis]
MARRRDNGEATRTAQEEEEATWTEQEEEEATVMPGQARCQLHDRLVSDLCLGNYDHALERIREALLMTIDRKQIEALLEIKTIVIRLCGDSNVGGDQIFGPTLQSDALPHAFTAEMLDVVQKVLRCRNHYEVLGLSQNDPFSEVKRSYKRLALRLHPDKNRAPGAEMAFRRISEAADCLTDHERRIKYTLDMGMGDSEYSDGENVEQEEGEEDYDGGTPRRPYMAANQRVPQSQALFQTEHLAIGMVCALLFMFLTMHFLSTVPDYSFKRTSTHSLVRFSHSRNIAYYMSPKTAAKYTEEERQELEQEIESVYIQDLKVNCQQETRLRDTLRLRARQGDLENMRHHAEDLPLAACKALFEIGKSSPRPFLSSNPKKQQPTEV